MSHCTISFDENEEQEMLSQVKKSSKLKQNLNKKKRKRNVDHYDDGEDENEEALETSVQEKIKCYFCDEYFTKQKKLKEHAQQHMSEGGNFSCKDCDKKMPTYKK